MSDREILRNALVWAVFTTIGVQTLLGVLCLWLGIVGNPYEAFLAVALWVFAIGFGIATYKRKMRGQSIDLIPVVVAMAAFVLFFWVTGTGAFRP